MRSKDNELFELSSSPESTHEFYTHLAKSAADENIFSFWGDVADGPCELCALFLLDALKRGQKMVTLIICSQGGEEDDMRGLIAIMEFCKAQGMIIRGYGMGIIASAAFDMLIACSAGYRYAFELTMLMTHSSSGHVEDDDMYKLQRRFDKWTLKKYTNIHQSTIKKFLKTGSWWFDPKTAVGYGAIDAVIGPGQQLPTEPIFPKRKTDEEQIEEANNSHLDDEEDE